MLATAPAPMLLREWDYRCPSGWLMSEKFDGVRAVWTGSELLSRGGHVLPAPDWFTRGLGSHPLDGEVWFGRGTLRRALSAAAGGSWKGARLAVFDSPLPDTPVEARISILSGLSLPPHCLVAKHAPCRDESHLDDTLDRVARLGGEGLVLRARESLYVSGRSGDCRKLRL